MPASPTPPNDLNTLYIEHHGWLRSWLRRRLASQEDAADLAQDTFIRILLRPPVLACLPQPRAYLASIARGLVIDHWRRQSLEQAVLEALASLPTEYLPSEQERLAAIETLQEIDRLLYDLSPAIRQTFVLSQLEGLGYDEIARRLGISTRTVKRHMVRAFEICLAQLLAEG